MSFIIGSACRARHRGHRCLPEGAILERSSRSLFDFVDGESHGSCTLRHPRTRTHHHLWRLRLRWDSWSPHLTKRINWFRCDMKVERLLTGCSQYAAIASIADCVPLLHGTRTLTRLGLAKLSRSRHKGMQELLKTACADPSNWTRVTWPSASLRG